MIIIICDYDCSIVIPYPGCDPQLPVTTTAAPEIPREYYLSISDNLINTF